MADTDPVTGNYEGNWAVPVLVQRVYMPHLGGSISRCCRPIGL